MPEGRLKKPRKDLSQYNKSRNYYKKEREHEIHLAILKAFSEDPELKYFIGMAAGYGITGIAQLIEGTMKKNTAATEPTEDEFKKIWEWLKVVSPAAMEVGILSGEDTILESWWSVFQLSSPISLYSSNTFMTTSDGLGMNVGKILKLTGLGFAGTCTAILLLKAIFSGTDLGDILQGVGEILPG